MRVERGFQRRRDLRLLALRMRSRPGLPQGRAGDRQQPVLAQARPQQAGCPHRGRVGPDSGGEVDVEPRHRRLGLGPRTGLEGQLTLQRVRNAGGEQLPLLPFRQPPHLGEGLRRRLAEPVQRQARAVDREQLLADVDGDEALVVGPHLRPLRGRADGDVERVVAMAAPEHRMGDLEQHQVEGGVEVAGQLGLDDARADGAQVVGQADADAGLLARLRLRVGGRRRRSRERRRINTPGCAASGARTAGNLRRVRSRTGPVRRPGLRLGHVLGPDQALDDLHGAALADRDDAAGQPQVLTPVDRPRLDGPVDRVEAVLDALRLRDQVVAPVRAVERDQFVVAGPEALDLGTLLRGGFPRLRMHPSEAGGGIPIDLDPRLRPTPAGPQFLGPRLQLRRRQIAQQLRVAEPDAGLVLLGEQVAVDRAAGRLVGFDAHEAGEVGGRREVVLGQHPPHLPGRRAVALRLHLLPGRSLAPPVGGDGERGQRLQVDRAGAVGIQQHRRRPAQAQALLHRAHPDTEARGDLGGRRPVVGQAAEGLHLIGRVHGDPDRVLGQRQFARQGAGTAHAAGHGEVGIQRAVPGQRLHRGQPAPAGDHRVAGGSPLAAEGPDDKVFKQPMGGDRGLEFGQRGVVRGRPAGVVGGEFEPSQRDGRDAFVGPEAGGGFAHGRSPRIPTVPAWGTVGRVGLEPERPPSGVRPRPAPARPGLRAARGQRIGIEAPGRRAGAARSGKGVRLDQPA